MLYRTRLGAVYFEEKKINFIDYNRDMISISIILYIQYGSKNSHVIFIAINSPYRTIFSIVPEQEGKKHPTTNRLPNIPIQSNRHNTPTFRKVKT
jgi:hypothetical protein